MSLQAQEKWDLVLSTFFASTLQDNSKATETGFSHSAGMVRQQSSKRGEENSEMAGTGWRGAALTFVQ